MALKIKKYQVTIRLLEDLLGTVPKNKEVYASFIADKAREHAEKAAKAAEKKGTEPRWAGGEEVVGDGQDVEGQARSVTVVQEEEVGTTPEEREEKGWTGFHTDEQGSFLYDYAIKGFLCEAARTLKEHGVVKQLQDKFKRYVFVKPRRNYVTQSDTVNERPLRAMTAQGPRVTVTRSDVVKAGFELTFTLHVLEGGGVTSSMIADVLEYGQYLGLGQWRSGGWGRFEVVSFEEIK